MASKQSTNSPNVVSLDNFSIQELSQLREELEQEISQLKSGFTQLKQAQATFRDCKETLDIFTDKNKDKPILVPLTESLYVPGKLSNIENVLVDVGTGYYVEKDIPNAQKFYEKKVDTLQNNAGDLQKIVETKQSNLRTVIGVLQSKASGLTQQTSGSK